MSWFHVDFLDFCFFPKRFTIGFASIPLRKYFRKGSDTRLILKWLMDFLSMPWSLNDVLLSALAAGNGMDAFHRLCFSAENRVWLSTAETHKAAEHLGSFMVHYYAAAKLCFGQRKLFFNLTPKYHYMLHLHDDLVLHEGQEYSINPAIWSTQMDEDYVGVTSRMSRSCHQSTVAFRTGDRWLVSTYQKWRCAAT